MSDIGETIIDPQEAAESAGLNYVNDAAPGITRQRVEGGFAYRDAAGRGVGAGVSARAAGGGGRRGLAGAAVGVDEGAGGGDVLRHGLMLGAD